MATRSLHEFGRPLQVSKLRLSFLLLRRVRLTRVATCSWGIERRLTKPLRRTTLREAVFHALRALAPPEKKRSPTNDPASGKGLRLLLAEDNGVNQKLAIRLLEKMGHRVVLAVNGEEAIEKLRQGSLDLVLMDIQMPVMGGVEATRMIREGERKTGTHIPILAMTAHAMSGDAEKCLQNGMDGYISKPIRSDLLRAEIDRLTKWVEPGEAQNMKEVERDSTPLTFDYPELLERVDHDRELLRDLLTIFKEEYPRSLRTLREAVQAKDSKRVAAAAHALKGMLSTLAATQAATTAAWLEEMGQRGETSALLEVFAAFESEAAMLLTQVDASMPEVCQ
jgi:two-component system sensor histidine kinase/response regulator